MAVLQLQILNELQHDLKVQHIEEVRVIKDKKTGTSEVKQALALLTIVVGLSRQFAFAQFKAIENARAFLDRFYPSLHLYGPYDPTQTGDTPHVKVRISFSREKEDREQAGKNEDDWTCDAVSLP